MLLSRLAVLSLHIAFVLRGEGGAVTIGRFFRVAHCETVAYIADDTFSKYGAFFCGICGKPSHTFRQTVHAPSNSTAMQVCKESQQAQYSKSQRLFFCFVRHVYFCDILRGWANHLAIRTIFPQSGFLNQNWIYQQHNNTNINSITANNQH